MNIRTEIWNIIGDTIGEYIVHVVAALIEGIFSGI